MSIRSLRDRLERAGHRMQQAKRKEQAAKAEQYELAKQIRSLQKQLDDAEHSVRRQRRTRND